MREEGRKGGRKRERGVERERERARARARERERARESERKREKAELGRISITEGLGEGGRERGRERGERGEKRRRERHGTCCVCALLQFVRLRALASENVPRTACAQRASKHSQPVSALVCVLYKDTVC